MIIFPTLINQTLTCYQCDYTTNKQHDFYTHSKQHKVFGLYCKVCKIDVAQKQITKHLISKEHCVNI